MGFCSDCARALLHCAGCSLPCDRKMSCWVFVSAVENGVISSAEGSATEMVTVILIWRRGLEYVTGCANGRARGLGALWLSRWR